jgi:hypothetical protein
MITLVRQLVLVSAFLLAGGLCRAAEVDFNRDIQPVLAGRCFKCHGPDENTLEAGLRLDQRAAAIAELDSGERAIVPGDPHASALLQRVSEPDPDLRMPPASEGDPLTPKQIEALRQWIAAGAEYERHWSFVPPQRPTIPDASSIRDNSRGLSQNSIDRFVRARLQQEGLQPSLEADRATLLRRVSLDLTGLPPTLEQADTFLADTAPDAYERLVDRLLASAAYGERWARVWLDLARYADSAGYADDPPRVIWEYRDWVIDALNANMPFDQFTIAQLAGDLLDDPTEEQLIATAFHRNTMTNSEGGTDDEEFRSAAIVDRVNTTLQVWMGLTIGCAQCHTHKYDPISQTDYYRVYAILNQTEDADRRDETPVLSRFTQQQEVERAALTAELETLKSELALLQPLPQLSDPPDVSPPDSSLTPGEEPPATTAEQPSETPAVDPAAGPHTARFVRIELPGDNRMLSLAEVQVFAGGENIAPKGKATQSSTAFDGPASLAIDGNTDGHYFDAKSTTHTGTEADPWWEVDLGSQPTLEKVAIWNRTDSAGIGARLNGVRILLLDADRLPRWIHEVATAPQVDASFAIPRSVEALTDADRALLARYRTANSPEVQRLLKRIGQTEKRLAAIKPIATPILRELPEDQRRATHVQVRGNFLDLGPEVEPGVLSQFHPLGETERIDRRALADWLLAEDNPLTARVLVNRHWEQLFGIGLVDTSEDFGLQGNLPSHPELLDWLAVEFRESGWDLKHLVRLIVTSATYRQTSSASAEQVALDPDNRLLARGPRFRLPAERIRDQALAIGGLLSRKMHGSSVYPRRPNLGLRAAFGGSTDWEMSQGEDARRRGLYTFWQRSLPYPSMDTFDAPSREVCTLRRISTNTPLQALVTLNDPVYVEAAQGLARRVLREAPSDDESRAAYAFRLCLIRFPSASEQSELLQVLQQARTAFEPDPAAAQKLATDPIGPLPAGLDPSEAAAWTVVGNVLLNLDETLARP